LCGASLISAAYSRRARRKAGKETATWPSTDSCEVDFEVRQIPDVDQTAVALILNRNAKGVTRAVEKRLTGIVGPERTFVCCCEEDAEVALREMMADEKCKVVVCGGGDGTVASGLILIGPRRREDPTVHAPTLCVLRLGTGNALAYVTGAKKNFRDDLARLVADLLARPQNVPEIPAGTLTLKAEGLPKSAPEHTDCFFAGLGYDARILQDYMWLRDKTKDSRFLKWLLHNPLGYLVALVTRTLPVTMRGQHVFHVKVTNTAAAAYRMDARRGDWAIEYGKDKVIYEGDVGIVSIGTVPFYGGGFRLFPFAGVRPGYAHLRLSSIHPAVATFNIRKLWNGSYRNHKSVHDFLVKDVMIEVDRPTPLHHSGDFMGTASKVRIQVNHDGQTRLVDFFGD
ncbi:unnamed protein product, partial [Effrenium voratum]